MKLKTCHDENKFCDVCVAKVVCVKCSSQICEKYETIICNESIIKTSPHYKLGGTVCLKCAITNLKAG